MINNNLAYFKKINKDFTTLYVEDNSVLRKQTIKMLSTILPNVIEATNGQEGIELYKEYRNNEELKKLDLIITDIQMPNKNGLEMISKIRSIDKKIPIVIFSAYDKSDYFLEAIKIGIDGYILKPYSLLEISETLIESIDKHKERNIINLACDFNWCTISNILKHNDLIIKLSKNEIKLIQFLVSINCGIKSSESIENYIFDDFISNNKRVRGLISRFNNKLKVNIIESIYAEGYRLKRVEI